MQERLFVPDIYNPSNAEAGPEKYTYSVLSTEELRTEAVTLTDGLIWEMIDNRTDIALFLDKSARPVSWMVKALWSQLAPTLDKDGDPYTMPEFKYVNIDREQWGAVTGRSEDEDKGIDINRIPEVRIDELRRTFAPIAKDSLDRSIFENKNVLVIDEVSVSGDTLYIATHIFERAFPEAASIKGAYWMHGHVQQNPKTGVKINTKLPVWYTDEPITGRLVANRDSSASEKSKSSRQREGKYWLSTTFREGVDQRGLALKRDVDQMAEDLRIHRIPYMPSPLWDDKGPSSLDERLFHLNGDMPVEDYIRLRQTYPDRKEFIGAFAVYVANHH